MTTKLSRQEYLNEALTESVATLIFDEKQTQLIVMLDDPRYQEKIIKTIDRFTLDMHLGWYDREDAIHKTRMGIMEEINSQWIADTGIAFDKGFTPTQMLNVAKHFILRFEATYYAKERR